MSASTTYGAVSRRGLVLDPSRLHVAVFLARSARLAEYQLRRALEREELEQG